MSRLGAVHVDTGGAAEEIARQQETAPRRGRKVAACTTDCAPATASANAVAGAKIAADPLDRWILTGRPGKHPHSVAVLQSADKISAQVTRFPCHEEGIHAKRPVPAT
jgi:hypothetical protein